MHQAQFCIMKVGIFVLAMLTSVGLKASIDTLWINIDARQLDQNQLHIDLTPKFTHSFTTYFSFKETQANSVFKVNRLNFTTATKHKKETNRNYWVKDIKAIEQISYDIDVAPQPKATQFYSKQNDFALLNLVGCLGYFEGVPNVVYGLKVQVPEGLNSPTIPSNNYQYFDGFKSAVATPLLIGDFKQQTIDTDNNSYQFQLHTDYKFVNSQKIAAQMQLLLKDLEAFVAPLQPANKNLIFCFLKNQDISFHSFEGGAVNDDYTLIVMPLISKKSTFSSLLTKTFAHEFLHVITPYHLHTDKTFDLNPVHQYSKHMWLYEGVTEYLSWLFLLQNGYINEREFQDRFGKKVARSNANATNSLSMASQNLHLAKNQSAGTLFYDKGALLAFALDIMINERWEGEKNLKSVLFEMIDNQPEKGFNDDYFIAAFEKYTGPTVGTPLRKILDEKGGIKLNNYLKKIGWKYYDAHNEMVPSYGTFQLKYNFKKPYCTVKHNIYNELGLQAGDEILAINQQSLILKKMDEQLQPLLHPKAVGDSLTVAVLRGDQALYLGGNAIEKPTKFSHVIRPHNKVTESMIQLRDWWLKEE